MKQKNRTGETIITSVSVTKDFKEILDNYDISPTEAFRRGVAVILYDLGVTKYQSDLNARRSEFIKKFFEALQKDEVRKMMFEKAVNIAEETIVLKNYLKSLEKENETNQKN